MPKKTDTKKKEDTISSGDCSCCNRVSDTLKEIEGGLVCDRCFKECSNCGENALVESGDEDYRGAFFGECCADDYARCDGCENYFSESAPRWMYGSDGYCNECIDYDGGDYYRSWEKDAKLLDKKAGAIMKSTRAFGVEIETFGGSMFKVVKAIDRSIGITEDGSIDNDGKDGVEFQTPPASGKAGEEMVQTLCTALNANGFDTNKSCGLHVHIDVTNFEFQSLRYLWAFYIAYEDVILSFLPPSRRINSYCYQLRKDYHFTEVFAARNQEDLEKIWYRESHKKDVESRKRDNKDGSRYRGINLHTVFHNEHLEVRYHSGTIDSRKILEWTNLHALIADIAVQKVAEERLEQIVNETDLEAKTKSFFEITGMTHESRDYFRARQEKFYHKPTFKKSNGFKVAANLIANESN